MFSDSDSERKADENKSECNPLDAQEMMLAFVAIVGRYPDIYQASVADTYRSKFHIDQSWKLVYEAVKTELKLLSSPDELKTKWKGIRSSYTRYKKRVRDCIKAGIDPPRKYYLSDALAFLEPHVKEKGARWKGMPETTFVTYDDKDTDEDDPTSDSEATNPGWMEIDIVKSEPEIKFEQNCLRDEVDRLEPPSKKPKPAQSEVSENEDLQFFRHILPDIAHFTPSEKRKLKIGVLKLVDDIENERQKNKADSSPSVSNI